MVGLPLLQTERLLLSDILPDDAVRIAVLCNNWRLARWLSRVPYPYELEDAQSFCALVAQTTKSGADLVWGIRLQGEKPLLGVISVTGLHGAEPELGYWLGEPFWGNGFMSEAAAAAVDAFFQGCAHRELLSGAFTGNEASLRIQARLGFRTTGGGQRYCLARGEDVEHVFTRLRREEWSAQQAHPGG
jgi:RimJ/RimL family protein N-acetyltransferase